MEFPHIGEHCGLKECNKLDFLPFKCIACSLVFCKDHYEMKNHCCVQASRYDHQVLICPICNSPVSYKYGDTPDVNMNRHIDENCVSKKKNKIHKNNIYKNSCSMTNCKDREIIKLICDECKLNYCLKHRHTTDHNCSRKYSVQNKSLLQTSASSPTFNAASQKIKNSLNDTSNFAYKIINTIKSKNTSNQTLDLTSTNERHEEDEALAIAIQRSLNEQTASSSVINQGAQNSPFIIEDDEKEDLERAIELSKKEYEKNKEKCLLS